MIRVVNHHSQDSRFERHWYANAVFYGLDITRFYDGDGNGIGDIKGLTAKLDYVKSLGVDCLWLLPFYPSDRRDNGYDVIDYVAVDKELGTLDDFQELVDAAHSKGLKIIIDLVVHHTSDKHPWFLESAANPNSEYRDYYVWSDEKLHDPEDEIAFPTEENSTWHYSETAGKYYHHKFYHFQPDLNIANPRVREEINDIVGFWMRYGVDGFRIDAATFMFAEKGITGTGSESNAFLEELRALIRQYNPDAILVGEADVSPQKIPEYFGGGQRMQLLYNFLLNNSLWEALARRDAGPITKRLHELAGITGKEGVWLNFLRNLDELNLDKLSDEKQEYTLDVFAPEPGMRIFNRGIRRRTAAMLDDPRRTRMATSLLFCLPGAPMFVYGDEIGMGDNLAAAGRGAVRIPMQWQPAASGGFTTSATGEQPADGEIAACAVRNGRLGYLETNVADQEAPVTSMLNFTRQLTTLRHRFPEIGSYAPQILSCEVETVFGLFYRQLVVLHNLSGETADFTIELPAGATAVFGHDYLADHSLPPYGFSWIEL